MPSFLVHSGCVLHRAFHKAASQRLVWVFWSSRACFLPQYIYLQRSPMPFSLLIPQRHLPGERSSSAFLLIPPILSLPLPREVFATNHVASFVVRVIKRTFFISPFSCSRFLSLSVSDKDLFPPWCLWHAELGGVRGGTDGTIIDNTVVPQGLVQLRNRSISRQHSCQGQQ